MQGGLLLLGAGLAAQAAREVWHHLWEWAKRRLLVRCELDSRDDAYRCDFLCASHKTSLCIPATLGAYALLLC